MNKDEKKFMNAIEAMVDMILSDDSIPLEDKIDFAITSQMGNLQRIFRDMASAVTLEGKADKHLKKEVLEYLGMVEAGARTFIEANNIEIKGE